MVVNTEIIKACMADDRKAIKWLYEQCFHKFMPICYRYNKNDEDARASLNAGFIKILKGLHQTDETLNFWAWSKRIMVNNLIDEYRKNKKYLNHISSKETDRELEIGNLTVVNAAESSLGFDQILKLITELPETSAKVFNLYVFEGFSHKEIGDLLAMSEGTSKWHLSMARKQLREKVEQLEWYNQKMVI
jgi:RNA polymerase sigma factor (sigma-70 family)